MRGAVFPVLAGVYADLATANSRTLRYCDDSPARPAFDVEACGAPQWSEAKATTRVYVSKPDVVASIIESAARLPEGIRIAAAGGTMGALTCLPYVGTPHLGTPNRA